jgi:tetratricopeptide (TPR) repeat protein
MTADAADAPPDTSRAAGLSRPAVDLLELVFARPREAAERARSLLDSAPGPFEASVAHHVIGLVQRDFGDLGSAVPRLRTALSFARRSGSAERESDVLATLGVALVHSGRTKAGLAALDRAIAATSGVAAARTRFRRGGVRWILGRHVDALADLRAAVPVLRRAGDVVWTARALTLRGLIQLGFGSTGRADADFAEAERLFASTDQDHDRAVSVHNRGLVAFRVGDLPGALARFDEADDRYRSLGTPMPELAAHRCAVLLAAGLPADALDQADTAIAEMASRRGQATRRAELLLVAGRAALASGAADVALRRATAAATSFTAQRRTWWTQHARLLAVQARFAIDPHAPGLVAAASRTARRLDELGAEDRTVAHLIAGRVALASARTGSAEEHLRTAARARHRGPAIARVDGWLALALLAAAAGDVRRTLACCRRGLDLLDQHRLTLGAPELRARATAQGAELAELALRSCAGRAAAREVLLWGERWRATTCAVPEVAPPAEPRLRRDLAAFREISSLVDQARGEGTARPALAAQAHQLERRIRDHTLRTAAHRVDGRARVTLDVPDLLDELGDDRLVEIVAVDGVLHVLVCGGGRVRRVVAGRLADASADLETARWALRRLAYRSPGRPGEVVARLERVVARMQRTLLGPAAGLLGEGAVVVVPPGRLHAVPWALLPCLADRAHFVAPSATSWLNARRARKPDRDDAVLVRGPGLAGSEIEALSEMYADARLLEDGTATTSTVLAALDGAALAHIAAHGVFRADSPLFSSITLDDGPLTAYDLQQLRRAPYRVVLPICESAALHPVGADELLGLTTALLPLGTAGIVASMVPVDDQATATLMTDLHRALRAGATTAEALLRARRNTGEDPVARATAWSFVALGAV